MNIFIPNLSNVKFVKFRKNKGKNLGIETNSLLNFGDYGLKATSNGIITSTHLEVCRKIITKNIKKIGKVWYCVFPNKSVTSKSTGIRMGKGKGSINYWCFMIRSGKILFEFSGISFELANKIIKACGAKLPFKTSLISSKIY